MTETQCTRYVLDELDVGRGGWIVTANLDFLRRLVCKAHFRDLCSKATLIVPDGMPLVWASKLQGTPLPERVTGSDLVSSLTEEAARRGRSVFLLGGAHGTADTAADLLQQRSPGLRIAGTVCPESGFEHNNAAVSALGQTLADARPDIVYIALGSPKQELVIQRIRYLLPRAWWLGVGISFSFLCGHVRRAPKWMQQLGLEWVHRFVQEPRRLAKRYLVDDLPFAFYLLGFSASARIRRMMAPVH